MGTSIKHPVPILCQTGLTRSGTGCFIAHAATVGVKGFSSSYVRRTGANAQFVNGIALSFGHFSAWIVTCISWGFASCKFIGSDASRDVCKICDFARNSTRLAIRMDTKATVDLGRPKFVLAPKNGLFGYSNRFRFRSKMFLFLFSFSFSF